jgi:hypothetical protein
LTEEGATRFGEKYYSLITSDSSYRGTTAEMTAVVAGSYEGFTSQQFEQKIILGDGSTVVDVLYNRNAYTVNLTKGEGVASVSGSGTYLFGQTVSLTATLAEGYDFSVWTSSNPAVVASGNVAQYSFAMPARSVGFTANAAIIQLTISIRETTNGSISPATTQTVSYGNDLLLEVEADYGYELKELLLNGLDVANLVEDGKYTIEDVKQNYIVVASFDLVKHTITATSNFGGEVGPEGTTFVTHGEMQNYVFSPSKGYRVKDVKIYGVSVGSVNSYLFENVLTNQTVEVEFEKLVFTIEVVCGDNGSVGPNGLVNVEYGNSKTFTITPNDGYGILTVELNGESLDITSQIIIESGLQNLMILCQDILLITTTQQLNKMLKIGNLDDNKKIKLMIKFQHLLDMNSYKSILDGRSFHLIRRFNSVPVKIQRMLIRRNPYNIQYINNPDQSIIDELRKKYGEDIDEYILGVL